MFHKTALQNSKSGFRDDGDIMSKMNVKNMEKMTAEKSIILHNGILNT